MKTYVMTMFRGLAAMAVAFAMVVCCTPDPMQGEDSGNQEVEDVTGLVDSLENVFYKQVRAMQQVLTEEDVFVASCDVNENGIFQVSLVSGLSFSVALDENDEIADALTYIAHGDNMYWAVLDKDGNPVAVEDVEGNMVELTTSADVKVVEKKLNLKVGEVTCYMGYSISDKVQMFDCAPLYDNAGVIYAVEFDFGHESKVVYVAEYSGLYFYLAADQEKTAVAEMYVNKAGFATLAVELPGEIAWTPSVSEGFTATVREENNLTYVDVVAATGTVFNGEQTLKAVSEDGSFVFAEVVLTDKLFHSLAISVTDAVITPSTGIGKFAYGISLLSDFDEQQILALGAALVAGTSEPSTGNGVSDVAVSKSFEEILGISLDPEARYVLWTVADGVLTQIEFGEIAVEINVEDTSLLDADLNVRVSGANSIFGGVVEKTDEMMSTILYQVNNLIYEPISVGQKFEYDGSASDFPVADDNNRYSLMPQTTYAVWVVPAVDGDYQYSEKDVVFKEFTTNTVTSGGSLELTCGDPVVTPSTISFPLSCEGAEMIYYAYFTNIGGNRYSSDIFTDEDRFEQIVSADSDIRKGKYTAVIGNSVDAVGVNLNDEAATDYWMFAVAVDKEGRYGKVICRKATTLALEYDEKITLQVTQLDVTATKATLKVTSNGGNLSDYIYWFGTLNDPFWRNSLNQTPDNAQKYMALNPEDATIKEAMRKYGRLSEDGTIVMSGLSLETKYVFVIMEKGETYYSKVAYKLVTTLSAELGNIARAGSDRWNAAKEALKFDWHKDTFDQPPHLQAYYSFDFTCPTNMTAYILCAGMGYYEDLKYTKKEQFMIHIEEQASRRMDKDHINFDENGEMMTEPDYYKNGVLTDGQLGHYNDFYVHGSALYGAVTYFAADSHKEGNCTAWENGSCANYDRAQSMIEYYNSIEPYQKRAEAFGLKGDEATAWANALYASYSQYYKDAKPIIYINDGSPLYVVNASATGLNEEGVVADRVYVMLKDLNGNYYEPMEIEVPNYFQ